MKKIVQKMLFLAIGLFLAVNFSSCKKEDLDSLAGKTQITVTLKDTDGKLLSGWTIYAFNEFAWRAESTFHAKQSATDANGQATFTLESVDIANSQEVYRFVVYYTINKTNIFGQEKPSGTLQKVLPVTIKKGENQSITLQL